MQKGKQEGKQEGIQEGMQKGKQEGIRETARNLKKIGVAVEQIAQGTGLSAEEIAKL
jgi:predicted transposase/invertase (TIGR01784 family)